MLSDRYPCLWEKKVIDAKRIHGELLGVSKKMVLPVYHLLSAYMRGKPEIQERWD